MPGPLTVNLPCHGSGVPCDPADSAAAGGRGEAEMTGFWDPVTASMDWCELNYAHSYYVAELFNSVSSLVVVAAGLLGVLLHRGSGPLVAAVFGGLAVIGAGSTAFHATLVFEMQLFDELPMLWEVLCVLYLVAHAHRPGAVPVWVTAGVLVWGIGTTVAQVFVPRQYEFVVFFPSFFIAQWTCIFALIPLYRKWATDGIRRCFWIGFVVQSVAFAGWIADQAVCGTLSSLPGLPNPQLQRLVARARVDLDLALARHDRVPVLLRDGPAGVPAQAVRRPVPGRRSDNRKPG